MRERTLLTPSEVTDILRRNKKKVTPQRLAVYAALADTTEHPTAETVYKSLDAFCEIGIVRELNVGEEAFRYDADISPHPHIRCMSCDRVADVPITALPALDKNVASVTGYRIVSQQMYFFGYCPECQKKKAGA